jgi:acyl-coenzyme A thioesterase 13
MATTEDPPLGLITSNLSADIAGSAKLGDWIEARVDLQKIGRTPAFAHAYLHVDEARIARVLGVFAVSRKD